MKGVRRELNSKDRLRLQNGEVRVSILSKELGITLNSLYHIIYRDSIKVPKIWYKHVKVSRESLSRFLEMRGMRKQGYLVKQIAIKYRLSSSRVSEILGKEESFKRRNILCGES